jgi:hypothetical protein
VGHAVFGIATKIRAIAEEIHQTPPEEIAKLKAKLDETGV